MKSGEIRYMLLGVLFQWSQRACTQFSQQEVMTTLVKSCQPRKLIKDSNPRFLLGNQSCRQPLPSMHKIPDSQKGNQVVNTNHCFCKQVRHSELALVRVIETLQKSKFPNASQGLHLFTNLTKDSQACYSSSLLQFHSGYFLNLLKYTKQIC